MKKIILVLIILVILAGCVNDTQKNIDSTSVKSGKEILNEPERKYREQEGVWIETEYETYLEGILEIKVKWYNTVEDEMMYGNPFTIDKLVEEEWKQVSKVTDINYGFTSIGYVLKYDEYRWQTYSLVPYTDGLPQGEYRISANYSRQTLNGKDYGAGNYPRFQVYGYFSVGNEENEREMTMLDDTVIEYKNLDYGFAIEFPTGWNGFIYCEEDQNESSSIHELLKDLDKNYRIIRLRHPSWTEEQSYQDIVLTVIKNESWNRNAEAATGGDFDLLPDSVLSNRDYIFVVDPHHYSKKAKGYDEVMQLMKNEIRNY